MAELRVFTTPTCSYCFKVKDWLREKGCEFTELDMPGSPGMPMLALLYSVDEDDPLTPVDESGGLSPSTIYISWMTGFSMPFSDPLPDDIDALTLWYEPLELGACCHGIRGAISDRP